MSDDTVMWPCHIDPPNNLRRGNVVRNIETGRRGVVFTDPWTPPKPGTRITLPEFFKAWGDVEISDAHHSGSYTTTSNVLRKWVVVPYSEQTAVERIRSTFMTWRPLSERTPEDIAESGPADDDQREWHVLAALLPEEIYDEMTLSGDWPTSLDLAIRLAEHLDAPVPQPS